MKSKQMTPEQRQAVVNELEALPDHNITPDEMEVILDSLVDQGLATLGKDGRYRMAPGVRMISNGR